MSDWCCLMVCECSTVFEAFSYTYFPYHFVKKDKGCRSDLTVCVHSYINIGSRDITQDFTHLVIQRLTFMLISWTYRVYTECRIYWNGVWHLSALSSALCLHLLFLFRTRMHTHVMLKWCMKKHHELSFWNGPGARLGTWRVSLLLWPGRRISLTVHSAYTGCGRTHDSNTYLIFKLSYLAEITEQCRQIELGFSVAD